ncbi:hypothetical protein EV182_001544 [Spiromyces aspiralis]|uniref:Uncharacterized protein n=1 Tax=Spiromyces aspiralis TaxID=68401 RepID=A0ACC1HTQ5_9FUNG|nr:hypothetical protein EV182_001544 [Spiromyces aspiralis]
MARRGDDVPDHREGQRTVLTRRDDAPTVVVNTPFNETFYNEIAVALLYSEIAYQSVSSLQGWDCTKCSDDKVSSTQVARIWDYHKPTTKGFMGYNKDQNTIVVSFDGTDSDGGGRNGWHANYWIQMIKFPREVESNVSWGEASRGFTEASERAFINTKDDLINLADNYPDASILVTGHSRGGALAALYASLFMFKYPDYSPRVRILTFGQPRIGNKDLAMQLNRFNYKYAYRICNWNDRVPFLPHRSFGYRQSYQEWWMRPREDTNQDQYILYRCGDDEKLVGYVPHCQPLYKRLIHQGEQDHALDQYVKHFEEIGLNRNMGIIY